jgi:AraC family transcriptional regulator
MAPEGQVLVGVALTPTRFRLLNGPDLIFDGMMMSGMTYVCRPAQSLLAEFRGEADFLQVYVATEATGTPPAATTGLGAVEEALHATVIPRDALIDHLARALQIAGDDADARYIETLACALVMRLMQIGRRRGRVSPLPKWRLKRVVDHIEAHIAEAISLSDLAAAAGLSRMHFAAQFRLATGSKPHDFVLLQRIEAAKRLLIYTPNDLVEIALTVGFQAQAHFSTVFKRLVGVPPGHWRRARLDERSQRLEAA